MEKQKVLKGRSCPATVCRRAFFIYLLICACISCTEITFSVASAFSAIAVAKPPFRGGVVMHFVLQRAAANQLGVFNRLAACGGVDDVGVFAILDTILNVRTTFMTCSPDAG